MKGVVYVIGVACMLTCLIRLSNAQIIQHEKRIINGHIAANGQFPWHVSLIGKYASGSQLLCGGSLISPEWVLTAAHCVLGMVSLKLGFGSTSLMEPIMSYENVTEYFMHPDYSRPAKRHDIALIRLPERIKTTNNIKIIELPKTTSNVSYNEELGWVIGFGRYIADSQVVSRYLRWTRVKVIANLECQRTYGTVVIDSTMCAVSIHNAGQNTCNGDSGGSLVVQESGVHKQVGVISFAAADNCAAGYPSGFMRIRSHLRWIHQTMQDYIEGSIFAQGGYFLPMHQQQLLEDEQYSYDYGDDNKNEVPFM